MLIELLVTCVLADGQVFTPPQGWVVQEVRAYDSSVLCTGGLNGLTVCNSLHIPGGDHSSPTSVAIRRQAQPGETIAVPAGCQDMTATGK